MRTFQSARPQRARQERKAAQTDADEVSIRAPAEGATASLYLVVTERLTDSVARTYPRQRGRYPSETDDEQGSSIKQRNRYHANPPDLASAHRVRATHSDEYRPISIVRDFRTTVFHPTAPVAPQPVNPPTVRAFVDLIQHTGA